MVALSLNCLVTGANEVISVEIDSEKTVLDLKKALQTADPTLIYGHISFVKLYLAKSTPETSKAKWQDVFRLVQNAMRSDQSEESEREGRPQSQRQPCEEMTSGRHLDSFVGIGERVTSAEKEPDVIVQRPDYEDLRNMQLFVWVWLAIVCVLSSVALAFWMPFALHSDWRKAVTGHYDCVVDPDHVACTVWPYVCAVSGAIFTLFTAVAVFFGGLFCCMYRYVLADNYDELPVTVDGFYRSKP